MKETITPNGRERIMRDDDFIVSKTDTRGCITYGNQVFQEFSGYSERELLGAPHNILRHPDMPRSVFKLMWESLQAGNEFFGYVKNLARDGSHYWVFANITPDFDETGKVSGYFSVRRKPKSEAVALVAEIYRQMLQEEQRPGAADGIAAARALLAAHLAQTGLEYEEYILSL